MENELIHSISENNTEKIKLIFDKSNKNGNTLNVNEKSNDGTYPMLLTTKVNNLEIIKLLIDYSYKNKIILEINEKDNDGKYPILWGIENKNVEVIKVIMDYANKNDIKLELNAKKKTLDIIQFCWLYTMIILRLLN